jgi:hypothetical protein
MKNKGYLSRMIYSILVNNKESRDDWMLVVKQIHDTEMAMWGIQKEDYYDALFSLKLANPQTVSRIWRKIQERCPDLRGEFWEERQAQGGIVSAQIVTDNFFQTSLF